MLESHASFNPGQGMEFLVATLKNSPAIQEVQVQALSWEDPLEKEMAAHLVFLPGKSHEQRSLVGYSPWGQKELDRTEATYCAHTRYYIIPTSLTGVDFVLV